MKFAVVDLETTGGTAEEGRITEIGIVLMDDCEVVKTYSAMVDPGMPIQRWWILECRFSLLCRT